MSRYVPFDPNIEFRSVDVIAVVVVVFVVVSATAAAVLMVGTTIPGLDIFVVIVLVTDELFPFRGGVPRNDIMMVVLMWSGECTLLRSTVAFDWLNVNSRLCFLCVDVEGMRLMCFYIYFYIYIYIYIFIYYCICIFFVCATPNPNKM